MDPIGCAGEVASNVVGAAATAAQTATGNSFADAMRDGASWVIKTTVGWWIDVPSIDLAASPAVDVRGYVWWISLAIVTAGLLWQGARMMLTRRKDPLIDAGRGLLTYAVWAAIGITGPALALKAGDAFSSWILDTASRGQIADRLIALASLGDVNSNGAVIILGLITMFAGLIQAVLMFFREGSVIILSGLLVLAAAGNLTGYGRQWLMKVLTWILTLVAYKPVAALVYATALTITGESTDPRSVLVGLTMLVLSVVALPVLFKFFAFASGKLDTGGSLSSVAAAGLGAAAVGTRVAAGMKSRSGAAGENDGGPGAASGQASAIARDLGRSGGGGAGGAASGAAAAAPVTAGAAAAAYLVKAGADTASRAVHTVGAAMTDGGPESGANPSTATPPPRSAPSEGNHRSA